MKVLRVLTVFLAVLLIALPALAVTVTGKGKSTYGIVIHGGAGTILKSDMTAELEKKYTEKLKQVLGTGYNILEGGESALDAVQVTVKMMEDSPLFNAGRGAVFNSVGKNEMDASIMDGRTLNAGAVSGVSRIRNPINLARLIMDKSRHVMMSGIGAEKFGIKNGIAIAGKKYFFTKRRWEQLKKKKKEQERGGRTGNLLLLNEKYGTVGAVALDSYGNLAAATSTGGLTNKRFGRVGDSPIIGAGTYANNKTCAISATGTGEFFMRGVIAYDISALMQYSRKSLKSAANLVILKKLTDMGGNGGIIGIDKRGNIAMVFNTEGMYRGFHVAGGKSVVKIYKD